MRSFSFSSFPCVQVGGAADITMRSVLVLPPPFFQFHDRRIDGNLVLWFSSPFSLLPPAPTSQGASSHGLVLFNRGYESLSTSFFLFLDFHFLGSTLPRSVFFFLFSQAGFIQEQDHFPLRISVLFFSSVDRYHPEYRFSPFSPFSGIEAKTSTFLSACPRSTPFPL